MKRIVKVLALAFMIIGISTTALAAGGYITWNGSPDFHEAMENLNLIGERGNILKGERDMANATNEQLQNVIKDKENVIKDKDNLISAKDQEIAAKEQEIENLKNQGTGNDEQLKQAEKDMKDVNDKTKEILNGLN